MKRALLSWVVLGTFACAGAGTPPPTPGPDPSPTPSAVTEQPDRSRLPDPGPAPKWALPTPSRLTLKNGMPVYFLEQGPTPLVTVILLVPGGGATDPRGKEGLTITTIDMLDEGAGGKGALELSEELQRLGTDYAGSADVDYSMLSMNLIAENLAPSIKLLADIVRRPAFDAQEFARRKQQRIAEAITREAEPTHGRAVVMRKALFGDGHGGWMTTGHKDSLGAIQLADVKKHYTALIAPEGASFVVVGGVDSGQAVAALEEHFGDWTGKPSAKIAAPSTAQVSPDVYFVDYPGSTQSAIALARRATGQDSDEYFPATVHNRAFGGAFTSRVNMNLREDKGYTYGARSTFQRFAKHGFFSVAASVKRETTRASIDEVLKELDQICGPKALSQEERDKSVGGLLLGYPARFETINGVAQELIDLPLYNRPLSWFSTFPNKLEAVDLASANAVGKKYCESKEFAIVVAGEQKSVLSTLESLERPIHFYDARGKKRKK